MAIKILPARLANQIAAGEVVERPASVVKELVENSLDAGATKIDIELSKGGSKLIRIRDNGCGVVKDELTLALSRHATSKIDSLDDLEAISSLGFRGEALASISSVSRLTLTSRTATQSEAWSAYAEGRDMAVKLEPAAHPMGTTVEVVDLFFNTPARKKFLRTEKTEFSHIDELIKRIALSRMDVSFILRHNGKVVRQYRAAKNAQQTEKRLQAVCGAQFVRHMVAVEVEHQGLKLSGWLTTPQGARPTNDLQFCYVNGRMMKDKLINHAIRQSYENTLSPEQYAAFVIYIELDPTQVDVNVHPAKHEVRFHQARLVHDFIYQGLSDALAQTEQVVATPRTESAFHNSEPSESLAMEVDNAPSTKSASRPSYPNQYQPDSAQPQKVSEPSVTDWRTKPAKPRGEQSSQPVSKQYLKAYQELMTTPEQPTDAAAPNRQVVEAEPKVTQSQVAEINYSHARIDKSLAVVDQRYLLVLIDEVPAMLDLSFLEWLKVYAQLGGAHESDSPKSQPLLIPLKVPLDTSQLKALEGALPSLQTLGFGFNITPKAVMVMSVPAPLRERNITQLIEQLCDELTTSQQTMSTKQVAGSLTHFAAAPLQSYTLSQAVQLLSEAENLWQEKLPLNDDRLLRPVDFSATIAAFQAK